MELNQQYQRESFISFLKETLLTDFDKDIRTVNTQGLGSITKAFSLGKSKMLDLQIFEFEFTGSSRKRITLTKEAFKLMRDSACYQALAVFHSAHSETWRLSFLTADPVKTEKGSVGLVYSNPKRYSFLLGVHAKTNTPKKYLVDKGKIVDLQDLKKRFSIEVVNKDFYKEVSNAFTHLVGDKLKLPSTQSHSQTNLEFAVRLIGRIIFCWFLREKRSSSGHPLMPIELISGNAAKEIPDYYHKILEPIFFEILNRPIKSRKESFTKGLFSSIPYLNGGLFSPHEDDFYSYNEGKQAINHNLIVIPDDWFKSFFEVLETYNFTIDENTSYDEELSIDPEMLGRIFENLLAEINPETGESARKSTGSYYTPRIIVDYMVDESLLLYLKEKTQIKEEKLRALISYDLDDDLSNPLSDEEKEKVTKALNNVKILDPACGSGAFPIGALQKIVFILQQIDPAGQLWFKNQIQNTPIELRRLIEREFQEKNFDYLRKLGIIRENIYGIDIQPIATEISRLRCFLTLIVDERIDETLDNRGIEPLPNLDFKFVTANSLIGLPQIESSQGELFDDNAKIDQLKSLRDQYFNARNEERKDLMIEFSDLQSEMINELIDKHSFTGVAKADLTRKLTDWKPFKHKKTDWFDPEWMFGIKDGFDIVIANPPYISFYSKQSQANRNDLEVLETLIKEYSFIRNKKKLGRFNTLMFFIERGISLLKNNSILNYIVDTNIHSNPSRDIREYLIKNTYIIHIVDNLREFENVASSQAILLVKKSKIGTSEITSWKRFTSGNFVTDKCENANVINESNDYNFKIPNNSQINKILGKISNNQTLSSIIGNENIRTCITFTGKKDKFVVTEAKTDIDYPLLEGSYSLPSPYAPIQWKSYIHYDSRLRDALNYEYKKLAEYEGKRSPMVIGLGDLDRFKAPKIFIRLSDKRITGTYTDKFICADLSLYLLTLPNLQIIWNSYNLLYFLGIINSKLITFYFIQNGLIRNLFTGTPQIRLKDLRNMPIVAPSSNITVANSISQVVEKINYILSRQNAIDNQIRLDEVEIYKKQIDGLVYQLYDLSEDEIKVVEKANGK